MFLLPWFFVGLAYMFTAMSHGKQRLAPVTAPISRFSWR